MNPTKNLTLVLAATVLALTFTTPAFAQTLSVTAGTSTTSLAGGLTSNGAGDYTFTGSNNVAPALVSSSLSSNFAGGTWSETTAAGNVWVATNGVVLGDPFVTYSVAFQNTTGTSQTFTFSASTPFTAVTYNPSLVRASFSGALIDGLGEPGSSVTASPLSQTASLTTTTNSTVLADTLAPLDDSLTSFDSTGPAVFSVTSTGYPGYTTGTSGTYNNLSANVTVTLSAGAFVAFSGRVDVIPEPSSLALMAMGAGLLSMFVFRRRA